MDADLLARVHQLNYLACELDALYHQAALRLGLADSAMRVLYALHDNGGKCLLSEIYKQSGMSRQTANSAIRGLEEEGILYLAQHKGKSKMARLTPKGEQAVLETAARLCEAEARAFERWTDAEIEEHVRLTEKYVESFRAQVQTLCPRERSAQAGGGKAEGKTNKERTTG